MGDNHLALLAAQGVGTHIVEDIEVRGLSLAGGRSSVQSETSAGR